MKPPLPPIPTPDGAPFQKFDTLFRAVMAVPKPEIDRREAEWKKQRARKKRARSHNWRP